MLLICPRACGAGQDIACKADADRLIRRDAEKRHKHWPDDRGGAHARKACADACARARQKADEDFG